MNQEFEHSLDLEELVRGQLPRGSESSVSLTKLLLESGTIWRTREKGFAAAEDDPWQEPHSRADLRWLHGFMFVGDWVRAWDQLEETEQAALAERARGIFSSWRTQHAFPADGTSMAFHDETTALRLRSLLAVKLSPLGMHLVDNEMLIEETATLLQADSFHAGANNHGMFQDGATLTYGAVRALEKPGAPIDAAVQKAWNRILEYAHGSFGSDGAHHEHSPAYHLLIAVKILQYMEFARALALEHSDGLQDTLDHAVEFATHTITPPGKLVPFGDTSPSVPALSQIRALHSPELLWAATRTKGVMPGRRVAVFEESGYAFFRTTWESSSAPYVAVANAYHGSYHKHSDELNVYVESGGIPILDDSGPYGYEYTDPKVDYAFSSHAHNTLLVDGEGLPRHDGKMSSTRLMDLGSTRDSLSIRSTTTRFDGVLASRDVATTGTSVEDFVVTIEDVVDSATSHAYTYLWHLAPDVVPLQRGSAVELFRNGSKFAEIAISSDSAHRISIQQGRENPSPRALKFPEMGELRLASVIRVDLYAISARVRTVVRTGTFSLVDRGVQPDSEWSVFDGATSLRYLLEVEPNTDPPDVLVVVFSSLRSNGDFTYDYRSALKDANVARLFILDDFGDQGCYYFSQAREMHVFSAVQSLIDRVVRRLGLSNAEVITAGSSKGGTAAIIHGYAYRAGRIIVGAPQTAIGQFTASHHPSVLRYMTGGTGTGDRMWADRIIEDQLRNAAPETRVSILVGEDDHHLKGHVLPFAEKALEFSKPISVAVVPDLDHKSIGTVYREYLQSVVRSRVSNSIPHVLRLDSSGTRLTLALGDLLRGREAACYLYEDGEVAEKTAYTTEATRTWTVQSGRTYFVRIFARGESGEPSIFNTQRTTVP